MSDQYDYRYPVSRPKLPILEAKSILAIADGLTREPSRPYAYDCGHGLSQAEYMRVVNWVCRRRGWAPFGMAEEVEA